MLPSGRHVALDPAPLRQLIETSEGVTEFRKPLAIQTPDKIPAWQEVVYLIPEKDAGAEDEQCELAEGSLIYRGAKGRDMDRTIAQHLDRWFGKRLSKLPREVRLIAEAYIKNWDALSATERSARAAEIDRQCSVKSRIKLDRARRGQKKAGVDPKQKVVETIAWYDCTLDAAIWWSLSDVEPHKAAMLLCRLNPNDDNTDPLTISTDETVPADYKRLLLLFNGQAAMTTGKHHTLSQWHDIAHKSTLKYHSWIDEYTAAVHLSCYREGGQEPQADVNLDRDERIRNARKDGKSQAKVAAEFGISKSRVAQIEKVGKRSARHTSEKSTPPWGGLAKHR